MEKHAAADLDDLTGFLARPTGLLLRSSGEGAHLVEQAVADGARAFGGSVPCCWYRRRPHSRPPRRTAALAPSPCTGGLPPRPGRRAETAARRAAGGRIGIAEAIRRPAAIEAAPTPYPWWPKFLGMCCSRWASPR
ncbi:hypothetical protein ACFRNJ_38095 [Streptomyces sp. NPDC056721]|uniref:hypothetical protein n=1 Tax=Streptomyces sp. NPDC056721 TaxID=3345923 RepID=UPI0036BF0384